MSVHDFPYEGTQEELDAVEQEMRDLDTQAQELQRQYRVLVQHRQHIIVLMRGQRPPVPAYGHHVPRQTSPEG